MGKYAYDFLNDSFLFNQEWIENNYSSVSEKELAKELKNYREHIIKSLGQLTNDIANNEKLSLLGSQHFNSLETLKQASMYLETAILPDPLFPFSQSENDISKHFSEYLGFDKSNKHNKESIAEAAKLMISLRPMVAANYVHFFPKSYYSEPPIHIPVGYSENLFSDVLPLEILNFYIKNAKVYSLEKCDKGFRVNDKLSLGRSIGIEFEGDDEGKLQIYNLFEQHIVDMDEETRIATFQMILPDKLPSLEQFSAWVTQSLNRSALAHFEATTQEISLAHNLKSMYICDSSFTEDLLAKPIIASKPGIHENALNCLLKMELPFLTDVSITDLMQIRQNDGEAFQLFRCNLESKLKELRYETDPDMVKNKIEDAEHELTQEGVHKVNAKMKSVRTGALSQAGIGTAGLAASISTSGFSLIATLIATLNGCKTYSEYREKVTENPSYFVWKVMNKGKKK